MIKIWMLNIDILLINRISCLSILTLIAGDLQRIKTLSITLRTLKLLFQRFSQTLKMKTVIAWCLAVDHIVETDGAVDFRIDIVLAFDDVFGGGKLWDLWFSFNFGPSSLTSVKRVGWVGVFHLRLWSFSGVFVLGFSLPHSFCDIFASKGIFQRPAAIFATNSNPILTTAKNDKENDNH